MNWDLFWKIAGHVSDILGTLSVVVSFALWVSFRKFKREFKTQLFNYAEQRQDIFENLKSISDSIFKDNTRDFGVISQLRQQLYIIDRHFGRLFKQNREDKKCLEELIEETRKEHLDINYNKLHIALDRLISIFKERSFNYDE